MFSWKHVCDPIPTYLSQAEEDLKDCGRKGGETRNLLMEVDKKITNQDLTLGPCSPSARAVSSSERDILFVPPRLWKLFLDDARN